MNNDIATQKYSEDRLDKLEDLLELQLELNKSQESLIKILSGRVENLEHIVLQVFKK